MLTPCIWRAPCLPCAQPAVFVLRGVCVFVFLSPFSPADRGEASKAIGMSTMHSLLDSKSSLQHVTVIEQRSAECALYRGRGRFAPALGPAALAGLVSFS